MRGGTLWRIDTGTPIATTHVKTLNGYASGASRNHCSARQRTCLSTSQSQLGVVGDEGGVPNQNGAGTVVGSAGVSNTTARVLAANATHLTLRITADVVKEGTHTVALSQFSFIHASETYTLTEAINLTLATKAAPLTKIALAPSSGVVYDTWEVEAAHVGDGSDAPTFPLESTVPSSLEEFARAKETALAPFSALFGVLDTNTDGKVVQAEWDVGTTSNTTLAAMKTYVDAWRD